MKRLTTEGALLKLGYASRESLRQMVKRRLIPPPVRDEGSTVNFYFESDLDEYLQKLMEKRQREVNERREVTQLSQTAGADPLIDQQAAKRAAKATEADQPAQAA